MFHWIGGFKQFINLSISDVYVKCTVMACNLLSFFSRTVGGVVTFLPVATVKSSGVLEYKLIEIPGIPLGQDKSKWMNWFCKIKTSPTALRLLLKDSAKH